MELQLASGRGGLARTILGLFSARSFIKGTEEMSGEDIQTNLFWESSPLSLFVKSGDSLKLLSSQ